MTPSDRDPTTTRAADAGGRAAGGAGDEAPRRRPGVLAKLALSVGVLVVALGALELGLRVAGFSYRLYPEEIRFGYPEPDKIEKGYFLPHDRFLWVSRKYPGILEEAQATHPDLVMLGCSCTEWGGYDVALEKLAERAGEPLHVANFGCSGWTTFQGRNLLEDVVVGLHPEVVTISFGWNDHWIGFGIEDKVIAELNASPWKRSLADSRVVQWIDKVLVNRQASAERTRGEGAFPRRVSLADFEANLVAMVETCRANDIVPVLMTAPDSHVEGAEPEYLLGQYLQQLSDLVPVHDAYVAVVRRVAQEHDVILCDVAAAFDALPRETLLEYMKDDGIHFTQDFGGPAVARELAKTLREHDLL